MKRRRGPTLRRSGRWRKCLWVEEKEYVSDGFHLGQVGSSGVGVWAWGEMENVWTGLYYCGDCNGL